MDLKKFLENEKVKRTDITISQWVDLLDSDKKRRYSTLNKTCLLVLFERFDASEYVDDLELDYIDIDLD